MPAATAVYHAHDLGEWAYASDVHIMCDLGEWVYAGDLHIMCMTWVSGCMHVTCTSCEFEANHGNYDLIKIKVDVKKCTGYEFKS